MHDVIGGIIRFYRQKGSRSHMQGDELAQNPLFVQLRKKLVREMQTGGRRGNRPVLSRIDGLIIHQVLQIRLPSGCNIGRQGHGAARLNCIIQIKPSQVKSQHNLAAVTLRRHGCIKRPQHAGILALSEYNLVSHFQAFGRFGKCRPAGAAETLVQID